MMDNGARLHAFNSTSIPIPKNAFSYAERFVNALVEDDAGTARKHAIRMR